MGTANALSEYFNKKQPIHEWFQAMVAII